MKTPQVKAALGLFGAFALILIAAAVNFLNVGVMTGAVALFGFAVVSVILLVLGSSGRRWTFAVGVVVGILFILLGAFYAFSGVIIIGADQLWLFIMSQVVALLVALQGYLAYEEGKGPATVTS